jgi:Calcineurin-like phosphoesterase
VVVSDVHGDFRGLEALLREVGAIDEHGERRPSHFVAQLGDLLHLGHAVYESDRRTLEAGLRWIDLLVLGNHEGFFTHGLESCRWSHIHDPSQVHPEVLATLPRTAAEGRWHVAAALDGWVLTHAGLHPDYQEQLLDEGVEEAEAVVDILTSAFAARLAGAQRADVFDSVGPVRGGFGRRPGGVLWADFSELEATVSRNRLFQIVGHTPQFEPRRVGDRLWCNDVGAALSGLVSALVKEPGTEEWTPVVVRSPDPRPE